MVMTYHRDWTLAKQKRVTARIARKKGVIGGKGSRERAKIELGGREGRIGGTMSVRRKVIVESIARSKTKMNLRAPREVGVGREQAKVEPAGLSAKISAIVNSIMAMIFGKR